MIDLLQNLDLISGQIIAKDKNGRRVKLNLNHEDLKEIKDDILKLEKIKEHIKGAMIDE